MNFRKFFAVAAIAASMACAGAQAQTSNWTIDPAHSSVEFVILHAAVSHIHGSVTGVKGVVMFDEKNITNSSVVATMDANSVYTANEARDKHLKSNAFFNAAVSPTITFKSTAITRANGKLQMTGDLTLNGVTKPVTLDLEGRAPVTEKGGKVVSGFTATGTLKRTDFHFGPGFVAPAIGDEVKLTIDVELDKI